MKMELNMNKKLKIVRFDRGGKFYGRYDKTWWNPGPFAMFLRECGIDAQYTMYDTHRQNGIVERRNHTLL